MVDDARALEEVDHLNSQPISRTCDQASGSAVVAAGSPLMASFSHCYTKRSSRWHGA